VIQSGEVVIGVDCLEVRIPDFLHIGVVSYGDQLRLTGDKIIPDALSRSDELSFGGTKPAHGPRRNTGQFLEYSRIFSARVQTCSHW
jgi:hypothetical protein